MASSCDRPEIGPEIGYPVTEPAFGLFRNRDRR